MRGAILALTALAAVTACSAGQGQTDSPAPASRGADGPRQAVVELLAALEADDPTAAAGLTVPGQGVAVAAAEQAPADEMLAVLDGGSAAVLANFWTSFASSLADLGAVPGDIEVGDAGEPFEVDGQRFAIVDITVPGQSGARSFIVRDDGGWWVDVVATFAPGLAAGIGQAPETFAGVEQGDRIVEALVAERPALEAALEDPRLPAGVGQIVRSAVVALGGR